MTPEERAIIGKAACALNRSISRYLVELATREKAQNSALLPEDNARLRFLTALFHGATEKVQAVLLSERFTQGTGEENAFAKVSLQEVQRLLEMMDHELKGRLP